MKTMPHLALVLLLALAGGAAGAGVLSLMRDDGSARGADTPEVSRLSAAVEELRRGQLALREALDGLSLQVSVPAPGVSLGDIDEAVERSMDRQRQEAAASAAAATLAADAGAVADEEALDVDSAMERLLDPELDDLQREALWQQVREAGLLDEVIAAFELRAKARPHDPDAQVDLGGAYLQKIFEVGGGPLAGVWATKADKAFDAALALDAQHWDARFTKAVSLSFWPPIFGKQSEAIGHFETLLSQQTNQSPQPQFAQTYLLLGNLYQQTGQNDLAQQTWSDGLQLFPDDDELQEKME